MIDPNAFTFTSPNKERALITACGVSIAFSQQTVMQRPPFRRVNGLWDTGATNSVINENIAFELGLKPVGVAKVHHANGESTVNRYLVNIMLPNNIIIEMVPVTAGKLSGTDVLIGMDIISMGDFSICHKNGGTTFSFQIPSTHDINFVDEIKEQRKKDKDTKTL